MEEVRKRLDKFCTVYYWGVNSNEIAIYFERLSGHWQKVSGWDRITDTSVFM